MVAKIKENKLAPDMIGGIIQNIEEQPLENLDWIESVTTDKNNDWIVIIKPKASYYPQSIIKYVKITKSRIINGKLFEIENQLNKAYIQNRFKQSL